MMRAVLRGIVVCALLAAGLGAQTLEEAVRALAKRVIAQLTPADVPRVTARTLSNLGSGEAAKARTVFERAIRRPAPRNPEPLEITLTLAQNVRGYLLVAEFPRNGHRQVEIVEYRPGFAAPSERAVLERELLREQDTPILDVLTVGEKTFVLEPSSLAVYPHGRAGEPLERRPVELPPSRDPRGRLEASGDNVVVFVPGQDRRFFLSGESVSFSAADNTLQAAGWPAFFSYARAESLHLLAETDGRVHIYDAEKRPLGTIEQWGSDLVSGDGACGEVLATGSGGREGNDTLTVFDLVESKPVAVSDPLPFSGAITALWPAPGGAVAMTRNSVTGQHAAYKITVRCSQ
jgi:hypothetical protein